MTAMALGRNVLKCPKHIIARRSVPAGSSILREGYTGQTESSLQRETVQAPK